MSTQVPQVPSRSGVSHKRYPVDESAWGECTACDIRFEDIDKLDEHMATTHPVQCSKCRGMAAYRTASRSRYSGAAYCAPHMDTTGHEPWYCYTWVLEPANDDAPRLPADHPLEAACRGLYGSREAAQRLRFGTPSEAST